MRQHISLASFLSLTVLAGCSHLGELPGRPEPTAQPITFEAPLLTPATRGYVVDGTTFPTDRTFTVWARWYPNNYTYWWEGQLYMGATMSGVVCSYDSEATTAAGTGVKLWSSAQPYYWPKQGTLTFYAVSPATETLLGTDLPWAYPQAKKLTTTYQDGFYGNQWDTREDGSSKEYYQVKTDGTQPDLMFCDAVKNVSAPEGDSKLHPVQLNFKHALANVRFATRLHADYPDAQITIKSIRLSQMVTNSYFNAQEAELYQHWYAPAVVYKHNYDVVTTAAGIPVTYNGGTPAPLPAADCIELLVIPQAFTNQTVEMTYTIQSPTGDPVTQTFTQPLNDLTYSSDVKAFEMGKKYTYNIIFALDRIYFSPEVTPWQDVDVNDIMTE